MSMNRFVGLGIFALSSSVLFTFAACDNSAATVVASGGSSNGNGGSSSGNTTTTSNNGQGGSSNSTNKTTTAASNGGSSSSTNKTTAASNGGSNNTSDTSGQGGSTDTSTASGTCDSSVDLVKEAATSETANWIQKDGCGIQGAIYAYSDKGLDGTPGNTDDSVQSPAQDTAATDPLARLTPCKDGKCCISGKTTAWPTKSGSTALDYDASVWGGGIGISLGDPGEGGTKAAYNGVVKGFKIVLSGTVNGQAIRIGYTQSEKDESAPFAPGKVGENTIMFTDPTCPTWSKTCVSPGNSPFDLQIAVVGGDSAGDFNLCIDSIIPQT